MTEGAKGTFRHRGILLEEGTAHMIARKKIVDEVMKRPSGPTILSLGARTDLLSVRDRQTDSGKAFRSGDLTDTSR